MNDDPRYARLAEKEKRKRNALKRLLAWMAEYDFDEGPGILEILIEEGFISVHTIETMTCDVEVEGLEE